MRKLLRSIAKANMEKEGIQHMNRKIITISHATGRPVKNPSYFATNWRKYC